MCSHYQTLKDADLLLKRFGALAKPTALGKYDMWPRYQGVFVRRPPEHDAGDEAVPEREALVGRWGMMRGRALLPAGGCSGWKVSCPYNGEGCISDPKHLLLLSDKFLYSYPS